VFYQLSHPQNRERQVQLRNELRHASLDPGCEVSLAAVKGVQYLDFIIKETLRYSPPIPFSMDRKVTAKEGLNVLGYRIPPGVSSLLEIRFNC
jgi:cytochrome P450